jgi:Flp pilus assembly protein TadG
MKVYGFPRVPRKSNRRGVATVEAAVTLPIFLLLLFGIMETGRFIQVQETLTDAAREGARHAVEPLSQTVTLPSIGQVQTRVNTFLSAAGITGATVNVTQVAWTPPGTVATQYSKVVVNLPYSLLSGISWFSMLQVNMKGEAWMRNETSP